MHHVTPPPVQAFEIYTGRAYRPIRRQPKQLPAIVLIALGWAGGMFTAIVMERAWAIKIGRPYTTSVVPAVASGGSIGRGELSAAAMRQVHRFVYLAARGEGTFKDVKLVKRNATIEDGKSWDLWHLHYDDKRRFGTHHGTVNLYICGDEVQQAEAVDFFHIGDHIKPFEMPPPPEPPIPTRAEGFISEEEGREIHRREYERASGKSFESLETDEDRAERANRI